MSTVKDSNKDLSRQVAAAVELRRRLEAGSLTRQEYTERLHFEHDEAPPETAPPTRSALPRAHDILTVHYKNYAGDF
jgi:hypothetical protein